MRALEELLEASEPAEAKPREAVGIELKAEQQTGHRESFDR